MNRQSKARARAERDHHQAFLLAALLILAAAIFLLWHGHARAEDFASPPQTPAAFGSAPGVQGCTDDMDFSPEDNIPSPFDADSVAWRLLHGQRPVARPIADDDNCQGGQGPSELPAGV